MIVGSHRAARWAIAATAALLLLIPAAAADDADFAERFAGDPFVGSVEVTITLPDEPGRVARRDRGRASAQFVDLGDDRLRLVMSGQVEQADDAGFVAEGSYDASGWRSDVDGVIFSIAPDGAISGGGEQPANRLRFHGSATPEDFDLTVELTLVEANPNGLPPGTVFRFHYALERTLEPAVASTPEAQPESRPCARIVWQQRNIATFSGAMQMIQVPVCMN